MPPARSRNAIGGPSRRSADTVVSDPHARYFGTELEGAELTTGDGARIGATDFDLWLAGQAQGAWR